MERWENKTTQWYESSAHACVVSCLLGFGWLELVVTPQVKTANCVNNKRATYPPADRQRKNWSECVVHHFVKSYLDEIFAFFIGKISSLLLPLGKAKSKCECKCKCKRTASTSSSSKCKPNTQAELKTFVTSPKMGVLVSN